MILMTQAGSLTFEVDTLPNPLPTLYEGWNLFAYFGATGPVADVLASIAGDYSGVYSLKADQQNWDSYDPNAPPFLSELRQLQQYSGYIIRIELSDDVAIVSSEPPPPLLTPEEFAASTDGLAEAVADLNQAQLKFIQDAKGGATAALNGDLLDIAAKAMIVGTIAQPLGDTIVPQDTSGEASLLTATTYYGVAKIAYAQVIEVQNLRSGLSTGSITPADAAAIVAEYGARLWNPGTAKGVNPFIEHVTFPGLIEPVQFLSAEAVAHVHSQLEPSETLEGWLSVSTDVILKTLTVGPLGEPVEDPFDPALVQAMTTATGQTDSSAARQVAAALLSRPTGALEVSSVIEVSLFKGAAVAGAKGLAAGILPVFAGGFAAGLARTEDNQLGLTHSGGVLALTQLSVRVPGFDTASIGQPRLVNSVPVTRTPGRLLLSIVRVHDGGPFNANQRDVTLVVRWQMPDDVPWQIKGLSVHCFATLDRVSKLVHYQAAREVKLNMQLLSGARTVTCTLLGYWLPLGGLNPQPEVLVLGRTGPVEIFVPAVGPDEDGDLVSDVRDLCPTEKEDRDGVADSDGCPETDADNDGNPDERDPCPEDSEDKCAADADRDGVPDTRDRCAGTIPGSEMIEDYSTRGVGTGCSYDQVDADKDGKCNPGAPSFEGFCIGTDECPNTFHQSVTDGRGCSQKQVDEDLDGAYERDSDRADWCPQGHIDDCPGTPAGATPIDSFGCHPVQFDTDLDGVCDPGKSHSEYCIGQDQCQTEKEDMNGVEDDDGCPDGGQDADGVPDNEDNCYFIANPNQQDRDADGFGDHCDTYTLWGRAPWPRAR